MFRWIAGRFWPALKTAAVQWSRDNGSVHSAALAYYAAFSLFPLCLTLIAALGVVARVSGEVQDRQEHMLDLVRQNIGPWLADQLDVILTAVKGQAAVGGAFGVLTLMVAALGVFLQLDATFRHIWRDAEVAGGGWRATLWSVLYQRLVAFLMLLTVSVLAMLLLAANMILSGVTIFNVALPLSHATWMAIQWLSVIAGNALLLALLFRTIPSVPIRWRDAFCGAVLAAISFQVGQHLLARFVIGDHYSVYGVVGSFIAVMVWFYYTGAVVIYGAEVVRALDPSPRHRDAAATSI